MPGLNPNDVLPGNSTHEGNKRFKAMIQQEKRKFVILDRQEKLTVVDRIYEEIKSNGGRFLQEESGRVSEHESGRFFVPMPKRAIKSKIRQALLDQQRHLKPNYEAMKKRAMELVDDLFVSGHDSLEAFTFEMRPDDKDINMTERKNEAAAVPVATGRTAGSQRNSTAPLARKLSPMGKRTDFRNRYSKAHARLTPPGVKLPTHVERENEDDIDDSGHTKYNMELMRESMDTINTVSTGSRPGLAREANSRDITGGFDTTCDDDYEDNDCSAMSAEDDDDDDDLGDDGYGSDRMSVAASRKRDEDTPEVIHFDRTKGVQNYIPAIDSKAMTGSKQSFEVTSILVSKTGSSLRSLFSNMSDLTVMMRDGGDVLELPDCDSLDSGEKVAVIIDRSMVDRLPIEITQTMALFPIRQRDGDETRQVGGNEEVDNGSDESKEQENENDTSIFSITGSS